MDDATLNREADARQGPPTDDLAPDRRKLLEPPLGRAGGRPGAARRRDHQPQLPGPLRRRRLRDPRPRQGHRRCSGSTATPSGSRTSARPRSGSRPTVAAMLDDPPCLVTEFVEGERDERRASCASRRRCAEVARGAARASTARASRCRPSFDSFRIVEDYAETARERRRRDPGRLRARRARTRGAIEAALTGPEHEPVPCHNDLLAANFIRGGATAAGSSTGSTPGWATATSTSPTSPSTTSSTRRPRRRCSRAYFGERAERARAARGAAADALHVRLPRGDVGRRPERSSPSSTSTSPTTPTSTSSGCARPPPTRASSAGSRRPSVPRAELPDSARCVIIGGGVGGTSIAYHLAKLGWDDVVLVDRAQLTSGSTFHSAGLVGQLRGSVSLTKMMMHSVELYRRLGEESEFDPGWIECGGIRLASSEERMEELRRQAGWAKTFGLPLELISADEAKEMFPLMSTEGVLGGAWLPTDGYLDPSQLTFALADGARRRAAAGSSPNTRVTGIEVERRARARRSRPRRAGSRPRSSSTPAACTRPRSGAWPGVRVPVIPMSHQYLVTQPFRERDRRATGCPPCATPTCSSTTARRAAAWSWAATSATREPAFMPDGPGGLDAIPPDFNGRLLEDDWDRFEEITENSKRRVPVMDEVTITKLINGPEAFTPDNEFCLGETEVARLLRRRRLLRPRARRRGRDRQGDGRVDRRGRAEPRPLAHGHPPLRRPVPLARLHPRADQGDLRDLLRHPLPEPRARGRAAAAGLAGQRLAPRARAPPSARSPAGSGSTGTSRTPPPATSRCARAAGPGQHWSPAIGAEHLATREAVGDLRRVLVREAGDRRARAPPTLLERLCDNQVARERRQDHLHADAQQPRRDRVRLHRRPARRGAVLDRHRHRLRQPRPRVDPPPPARRRQRRRSAT